MPDFIYNSSISRENQSLVINNIQIPGVQSFAAGYVNPTIPLKYLGMPGSNQVFNGRRIGKVDISTLLFSSDFFLSHTGENSSNGALFLQKSADNNIYFENSYLTSYSTSYSLETPPEINVSFAVFNELGKKNNSTVNSLYSIVGTQHPRLKTVGPGSVNFNNSIFDSNRVMSYNIDITVNRNPFYILGNVIPNEVKISYPIEINCAFDIEVSNYQFQNLTHYPNSPKTDNINLVINDMFTNENVCNYNFGDMTLISENLNSSLDGNVRVQLVYQKFLC